MLSVFVAQAAIFTWTCAPKADCECELVLKSLLVFVVAGTSAFLRLSSAFSIHTCTWHPSISTRSHKSRDCIHTVSGLCFYFCLHSVQTIPDPVIIRGYEEVLQADVLEGGFLDRLMLPLLLLRKCCVCVCVFLGASSCLHSWRDEFECIV